MRSVLVGAVDSTRVTLDSLVRNGVPPLALVTLPLHKSHRHSDFIDVAQAAENHQLRVIKTANSNAPELIAELKSMQLDWIFVIGWSQICKPEFIEIPKRGVIGYHPAQLPENRGRAVLPWTILQRKKKAGASIFWIDKGVDSGDLIKQSTFDVAADETARSLYDKHIAALEQMMDEMIPLLDGDNVPREPQDNAKANWCAKRTPADGLIDWNRPADDVWTMIRAVGKPYPGAFSYYNHQRVVLWQADLVQDAPYNGLPGQIQKILPDGVLVQCGDGHHVLLQQIQLEGSDELAKPKEFKIHGKFGIDWLNVYDKVRDSLR